MNIIFEEGQEVKEEILSMMERAAEKALELEEIDDERIEISVTFVSKEEIKEINGQFRDMDKVTDVLSFPQFEDFEDLPEFGEIALGDVVICLDKAKEQAEEFGHSVDREILYLFTHSILHLLGYDHMQEDEKKVMRKREEEIMAYLDLRR
ncbi:MAG: rRNA maturation RNase YbeY [Clostridia bacterium]|nr:rRNA maturation RNase YbeY [Clostridia bacterium]